MPTSISSRPNDIRIDQKTIAASEIRSSPASGAALEQMIASALATQEITAHTWDLYVHVHDKANAAVAILMCRHGMKVEPDWWSNEELGRG